MIKLLLLLSTITSLWAASAVNPVGGVRINYDATGTNTISSSVTITNSTDLRAKNLTATNSVKISSLVASRAAVVGPDKTITNGLATLTEINYSHGLVGNIQDQLDALIASTNTLVLATVPDLVAYNVGANTNIYALVKGRLTANDGGGGLFYYVSGSTATTNLGTIFQPQTSSGRWLRLYSGPLNVIWFGAVTDGVADSTAAFQDAIDVGNNLYVPTGNYKLTATITSNNRLTMAGDGMEASKLVWGGTGSTNAMLVLNNGFVAGSVITGLSFSCNDSINALLLVAHTEAQIYNNQFYSYRDGGWGVRLVDAVHANVHENRFRSSPTTNTTALLFDGGSGQTVWGNSFATGAKGIGFVRGSNGLVIGPDNRFEPNYVGIEIPTLDFFNSMTILGNFFESNTHPIYAGSGSNMAFSKLTLIGNTFAVSGQTNYFENINGLMLIGNSFADTYIGTNVVNLNRQNNNYNNPPTIIPTDTFSLDTAGQVNLGAGTDLRFGGDAIISRVGTSILRLDSALGINTTPLSALHVRWPSAGIGGFQPFLLYSTDSPGFGVGPGIGLGGQYTNGLYATWAEVLAPKSTSVAGDLGGYMLLNVRDTGGTWMTNTVVTQYGLSLGMWPPIPARLTAADITPANSNWQIANLMSTDTVAADTGGTLGFGGKYNGTNIALWAQLRGLKTNSTAGDLAAYLSLQVRDSGGAWGEAWRFSTGDVAPGNSKFYGTDGSGNKGWFTIATGVGSASNLGTGVGVYAGTTSGTNLTFNSISGTGGITTTSNANRVVIGTATGAGITNSGSLLSANLIAGANVTLTTNTDGQISIASSGGGGGGSVSNVFVNGMSVAGANFTNSTGGAFNVSGTNVTITAITTASNAGTGVGTYASTTSSTNLVFNSLTGAHGITVSSNASTLTIDLAPTNYVQLMLGNPSVSLTTGNTNFWVAPVPGTIKSVTAHLLQPSSSGSVTLELKKNGTTVLSSAATLASSATNATATVSVTSFTSLDRLVGEVTGAGTSAAGAILVIGFTTP